jgi:hypothetical protein
VEIGQVLGLFFLENFTFTGEHFTGDLQSTYQGIKILNNGICLRREKNNVTGTYGDKNLEVPFCIIGISVNA